MKFVHIVSLGCPKNLVDAEIIAGNLITHGFGITANPKEADIFLINTCSFIQASRDESEAWIKNAIKWKQERPKRIIAVCGCLPQSAEIDYYRKKFPQVEHWIGIDNVENIHEILSSISSAMKYGQEINVSPHYIYSHLTPRLQLTPRHYAYVKISDGCDNKCSYCAIPGIRGALRSRSPESILTEIKNLAKQKIAEIILIGQDTTSYGKDIGLSPDAIAKLIGEIDRLEGDFKLRLMYAHPAHFSNALIDAYSQSTRLLHYIDLPLQHISNKILKLMGRKHNSAKAKNLLSRLRAKIPDICIRTSLIVGFPGETESDFKELFDFVREIEFDRLGVFMYSPEKGTPACSMPDQVPHSVATERFHTLMELQSRISLKNNTAMIGKTLDVLIDEAKKGQAIGRSYMDAPEIDNIITIKTQKEKLLETGKWLKVKITKAKEYELHGIPASS